MASYKKFGIPWPECNDGLSYDDVVPPSDAGLTLIEFYSTKYKSSAPLQGWLQRIKSGQITVDGRVVTDSNTVLRVSSKLVYHRLPWKEPDAPHMIEVLCEDDDMIALNKPSGLQVLPGGLFQQRTVLTQLQWEANNQGTCDMHKRPHPVPVHRLGRGTSGILLCAKTKLARAHLASYFAYGTSHVGGKRDTNQELGTIAKIYRALVSGIVENDKVTINQPIGIVKYPGVAKGLYVASQSGYFLSLMFFFFSDGWVSEGKPHLCLLNSTHLLLLCPFLLKISLLNILEFDRTSCIAVFIEPGKPALSVVDILERNVKENSTLVQVKIQSGRPHQIRIHLSFIGHPLLGDPLYVVGGQPKCLDCDFIDESFAEDGGYQRPTKPVPGDCGYHLHAHRLLLSHPITNELIEIIAPIPSVLRTAEEDKEIATMQQVVKIG